MKNQEKIFVIGHKNPDTDSICSAIAYCDIKNRTTQESRYIPKRAGQINEETEYVLNRFGVHATRIFKQYRYTGKGYGYPPESGSK